MKWSHLFQLNEELNAYQRRFVMEVKQCDELDRKLRYIEDQVKKEEVEVAESEIIPKALNPRQISDLEVQMVPYIVSLIWFLLFFYIATTVHIIGPY